MGRSGIFVSVDEVLRLLEIDESKLKRLIGEGELRNVREGDQIMFRLADACRVRMDAVDPPDYSFFLATMATEKIGISPDQLMRAVGWHLVPFGRTRPRTEEVPQSWIEFWAKERVENTQRWRDFLATIAKPIPK